MPAIRTSACSTATSDRDTGRFSSYDFETRLVVSSSPCAPTHDIPEPTKKRRSPNAFMLFRSFIVSNKFYPPEIKHQNEVSRIVGQMWRSAPALERALFFKKAEEEKLRIETEGPSEVKKKKRTRKPRQSKASQLDVRSHVPQNGVYETGGSTSPSSTSTLSSDSGDRSMFPAILNEDNVYMSSPSVPQPMPDPHSVSPTWNAQSDVYGLDPSFLYSEPDDVLHSLRWSDSPQAATFLPAPHANAMPQTDIASVAAFDNALKLELDFLLTSDAVASMPMLAYPDYLFSSDPMPIFESLPCSLNMLNASTSPF